MASKTNQRTTDECKKRGWTPWVVEKFVMQIHKRFDLWGIIDVLAMVPGQSGVVGIQATDYNKFNEHREALLTNPNARLFVECGNRLFIFGWAKRGAKGKRKLWELTELEIKADDFQKQI
jgi:hypothetical protein